MASIEGVIFPRLFGFGLVFPGREDWCWHVFDLHNISASYQEL